MIGIYFVSIGLGGKVAGVLAKYSNVPTDESDIGHIVSIYRNAFFKYMIFCFCISLLSILSAKFVNGLIKRSHEKLEPIIVSNSNNPVPIIKG